MSKTTDKDNEQQPLTDLAESMQMGIYVLFKEAFQEKYGERSGVAAAGIANLIFRFGDLGEKINSNRADRNLVQEAFEDAFIYAQQGDIRREIAIGVIAAASVFQVPLPKFVAHLEMLYRQALIDIGEMTPDIGELLPPQARCYLRAAQEVDTTRLQNRKPRPWFRFWRT